MRARAFRLVTTGGAALAVLAAVTVAAAQATGAAAPKNGRYAGTCGPTAGGGLCSVSFTISRVPDGRALMSKFHDEPPACKPLGEDDNVISSTFVQPGGKLVADAFFAGDVEQGVDVQFKKPTQFRFRGAFVTPTRAVMTLTAICDAGTTARKFSIKLVP